MNPWKIDRIIERTLNQRWRRINPCDSIFKPSQNPVKLRKKLLSLSRLDNFVDFLSNKIKSEITTVFLFEFLIRCFFREMAFRKKNYPRVLQIISHEQRSKRSQIINFIPNPECSKLNSESRHLKLQSLPESQISGLRFDWDRRDLNLESRPLVKRPLILKK